MQLTHSLKPPGFNPRAYEVKTRFQSLPFKFNLYRYNEEGNEIFAADMLAYLERAYPGPITSQQQQQRREQRRRWEGSHEGSDSTRGRDGGGGEGGEVLSVSKGRWLYDGIVAQMRFIAAHTVASVAESLVGLYSC
jgi:hypothetical protein